MHSYSYPILEEAYRVKEMIAARHGFDMASLYDSLLETERQHADRVVTSLENLPIIDPKLNSLEALGIEWDPSIPAWDDPIVAEVHRIREELYLRKMAATASAAPAAVVPQRLPIL